MQEVIGFQNRAALTEYFHKHGADPQKHYLVENEMQLYKGDITRKGFVVISTGATAKVYPGDRLFHLRATHGLPLSEAIERIYKAQLTVTWSVFLEEARKNGWYDFQSLEAIEQAWLDADMPRLELKVMMAHLKSWICENPMVGATK